MTTAGRGLSLLACLSLAIAASACSGSDGDGAGPSATRSTAETSGVVLDGTTVDTDTAEQVLDDFDGLDEAAQEQQAADADRDLERATWGVSGLDDAVGADRADTVFDEVNSGVRADLATYAAPLGTVHAFGTSARLHLDELSEAQGASLFGAVMISSLSADAAAHLVDGEHTGSGTENGVTQSATRDQGTVSVHAAKEYQGVTVTIDTSTTISPCPDASGRAVAEGSMAASATKDGVGHRFSYQASVEIQVGDDAEVASTTETFQAEQGDASASGEQYVAVSVDANGDYTVTDKRGDLPADYAQKAVNGSLIMSRLLAHRLVSAAEGLWKSGRCVRLEPTASDGPSGVRPGASITLTAAPRSVMDGGPVGGTVTARLTDGAAGVEPSGTEVNADATFTYTAPPEVQQIGEVGFEARSRRGVAKASLRFDTYPLSFVAEGGGGDFHGEGVICDLREPFTISGTDLTLTFEPKDRFRGSYTLSGGAAGVSWSGAGTYKVKLNQASNAGTLRIEGTNTIRPPTGGAFTRDVKGAFTLRFVHACSGS